MSKPAKKLKKEDEARLAEEKAAFEERLAVDKRLYRLRGCADHPNWAEFLTPENVASLLQEPPNSVHTVSFLLFVRLFEAKLTGVLTCAEFQVAAFVADAVFGFYWEGGRDPQLIASAVNLYLNEVLGLCRGKWEAQVKDAEAQTAADTLFDDWKEGRFRLAHEKLEEGVYSAIHSALEDAEGVWAEPGTSSGVSRDWDVETLTPLFRQHQDRLEKLRGKELGFSLAEDFCRLFGNFRLLFEAYLGLPAVEFLTEEVKAVERPKSLAQDYEEDLLRPLQALNAAQNGRSVNATPRSQARRILTTAMDFSESMKPPELDEEALEFIRSEVGRVRERLQAELDAKAAEPATNKKGKK